MNKPVFKTLFPAISLIAIAVIAGCGTAPTHPTANATIIEPSSAMLPAVAAEFLTTRESDEEAHAHYEHEAQASRVHWRFWRNSKKIDIERPQLGVGESWQQDGRAIIHRKLYHADQRAIEFQQDDLKMLEAAPSWHKLSLLLDQSLLEQLSASDIKWSEGFPVRDYQGTVNGTAWHIVMRMDIALPILVESRSAQASERTELLNAYALTAAPWQPTPSDAYEVIDYADLGDKEYDPFVIKVQAQMGQAHHH